VQRSRFIRAAPTPTLPSSETFDRLVNTAKLKSFAPKVRRQLMNAVVSRLDHVLTADTPDLRAAAN
jgi:hypothetical protein